MPEPGKDESRGDFIGRCIPIVLDDGTAEDQDQAVAVCISMWNQDKGATMADNDFGYKDLPKFERKRFPSFVKEVDEDQGIVKHIVAVIGNIDDVDDRIEPGAFTKTITEHGRRVKVLDQHGTDSVLRVVGKPMALREVGRDGLPAELLALIPEATGGLEATTQYATSTARGHDVFELVKGGFLPESSIGYDAIQVGYTKEMVDGKEKSIRGLKEIRLWEYSNAIWGANEGTWTISAKEAVTPADSKDNDAPPPADTDNPDAPNEDAALQERKSALTDSLRAALVEAEALELLAAPPAPADDAGRDDDADDPGAGPVIPPTSEDTERLRAELLESLATLED